jgi:hypothetical protein
MHRPRRAPPLVAHMTGRVAAAPFRGALLRLLHHVEAELNTLLYLSPNRPTPS